MDVGAAVDTGDLATVTAGDNGTSVRANKSYKENVQKIKTRNI